MATLNPSSMVGELSPEEIERLHVQERREAVKNYRPPKWKSSCVDEVSGKQIDETMVDHANIVFIGPIGSGKSSLIGSLYRSVNEEPRFPNRVSLTLNHPDEDNHGTMQWIETSGNPQGTIVYQDTRGDQEFDSVERDVHECALRGMFKDSAPLHSCYFSSREWWVSRRFFWERGLKEMPHCVVFVFDGSSNPFLDPERLEFFRTVFRDCTELGYEPVIVVTCLDLIHQELRQGGNFDVQVQHKKDKVLQSFENLNLIRKNIYFVTNFHEGRRDGLKVWDEGDKGFTKSCKVMVDLAHDLLAVADRFIMRKYAARFNYKCSIL